MPIRFVPIPTKTARDLRAGCGDANGQPAEHAVSDGVGYPCRHCLRPIPEGEGVLVLAYRPFPAPQPYAEIGPIFLCATDCPAPAAPAALPAMLASPEYILRGYGADDRIVYGTGRIIPTDAIPLEAATTLADPRVAYVHIRSARNNCFQVRIEPA